MRVTDFNKDLNTSRANTRHSVVVRAIQEAFPGVLACIASHETNDRLGVDVWLELAGQRPIGVDLKIRAKDYAAATGGPLDCVLELRDAGKCGWSTRASLCDWLLFVCTDTGRWAAFRHADILAVCTMWGDAFLNHPRCKRITTRTASRFPHHYARDSLAVAVPADLLQKGNQRTERGGRWQQMTLNEPQVPCSRWMLARSVANGCAS
ncbi:hypothetical protein [Gulbenkiania mobilis]|uniref:Restriction endonuclease n=1 Tax=Gulbenkiania mobilis TaxID=397457 RepID=A0ABY2CTT0_GULMO|nr:hypothetical protein EV669_11134 [Gulbenkiania mobilis]